MQLQGYYHFLRLNPNCYPTKEEAEAYFRQQRLSDGRPISREQAFYMAQFIQPPSFTRGGQHSFKRDGE